MTRYLKCRGRPLRKSAFKIKTSIFSAKHCKMQIFLSSVDDVFFSSPLFLIFFLYCLVGFRKKWKIDFTLKKVKILCESKLLSVASISKIPKKMKFNFCTKGGSFPLYLIVISREWKVAQLFLEVTLGWDNGKKTNPFSGSPTISFWWGGRGRV